MLLLDYKRLWRLRRRRRSRRRRRRRRRRRGTCRSPEGAQSSGCE